MHWEKKICIRITIRRIVVAVLTASALANLVIVGVVVGAESPAAVPTAISVLPTPLSTNTFLIPISGAGEASTLTPIPDTTLIDTFTPTLTSTNPPLWIVCIKRFYWSTYLVQPGDTLFSLASAIRSSTTELTSANCLTSDQIHAGQLLYVPRLPVNMTPFLSATSTATQTPTLTLSRTSTYTETTGATMTNSPTATGTPSPTETATSTQTNTPTTIATNTTPPGFCDQAEFIADVTIPPGTIMLPGERFTKTWRFKNIGSCVWTQSYAIVYRDGEQFGAPDLTLLPTSVAPGQTVDVFIEMIAPSTPGFYGSYWMFRSPTGAFFGMGPRADESWTMEINVSEQTPTDAPTVFENPTGYPACDGSGSSRVYFFVTPFDPQDIRSVTVFYTTSKSFFAEATMISDGATYFGAVESRTEPITYFFRAVDGFGNVTDSDLYEFSIRCP